MLAYPFSMKPRAILFDWDGTLADVYPITRTAINYVLASHGKPPLSEEESRVQSGWTLEKVFPDEADRQLFIAEHNRLSQITPPLPMTGADALVRHIRNRRVDDEPVFMGVISNKPHALILEEMQRFGWDGMFDVIVGSDDVAKRKPDPLPLAKALEAYPGTQRPTKAQTLYVGDTDTDHGFAKNCGIKFVGVGDKFSMPLPITEHCTDLTQLLARLQLQQGKPGPEHSLV